MPYYLINMCHTTFYNNTHIYFMYIPVYVTKYMLLNYRSKRSGYFIFGIGKHKVNLFIQS